MSDATPLYDLMLIIAVLALLGGFFLFVIMRFITVVGSRAISSPYLWPSVAPWRLGLGHRRRAAGHHPAARHLLTLRPPSPVQLFPVCPAASRLLWKTADAPV